MIKFFNNVEKDEKFMAIVNNLKKVADIEYEGYDVSDSLDEKNDFMDEVGSFDKDEVNSWFSEIYDRWMCGCCDDLSVETINKSFEAALNGKRYYDAIGILDKEGWDKGLVEYVLNKKDDFAIINDKDDYEKFLYKYKVIAKCPAGYYIDDIDLWRSAEVVEEDVAESMEDCVMNDFYENEDGDYIDDEGNVIDVKEMAEAYAEGWLEGIDYESVDIEYYDK